MVTGCKPQVEPHEHTFAETWTSEEVSHWHELTCGHDIKEEKNHTDARINISKTLESQWNTVDVCRMKIEYQELKIESCTDKIKQQEIIYASDYGSETDVLSAKINRCNEQIEKVKQS